MANTYSNTPVEDLVWAEIHAGSNPQDFLVFTQQFSVSSPHWFTALDQAVSLFIPGQAALALAPSRYPAAFERVRELAHTAQDPAIQAVAFFALGKMTHEGWGTPVHRDQSIEYYKKAIALGEVRALVNCGAHFDGPDASADDLAYANTLFDQAAERGEPMGLVRRADRMDNDQGPEKYPLYLRAAEMGLPIALHRVGVTHLRGDGGRPADEGLGVSWLARAAKAGCGNAAYLLGWFYERDPQKNLELSREWHGLGATLGHASAMRVYGIDLLVGCGGDVDEPLAFTWLYRAAVLGDQYARFRIGHYLMTLDDPSRHPLGLEWLKLAADDGHDYSAWRVSLAYRDGKIFDKDPQRSFYYCEIAARAGYPEAQGQLGLNYWYGNGVAQDYAQAYKWVNLCALQGESRGLYLLGIMTERGLGCTANPQEAFALYQQAAAKGDLDAVNLVAECYWYGECVEKDPAEAILWFKRAADQGHAKSMTDLGCILHDGDGVLTNYEESLKWFSQAAERDDPRAMYMMAIQYYNGDGVDENEELCRRWMSRSAMLDYAPAKRWIDDHLPKAPQWLEQLLEK